MTSKRSLFRLFAPCVVCRLSLELTQPYYSHLAGHSPAELSAAGVKVESDLEAGE